MHRAVATVLILAALFVSRPAHFATGALGRPARAGSPRIVVEPRDGSRPMVHVIDAAKHSLFVEVYILTDRDVVRALERAAAQGVRVDVMLEPHPLGMGDQPMREADLLRAAGVSVKWTPPQFRYTHAKYLVADERVAVISSANFSFSGFTSDRDFQVIDRNKQDVRQVSNLFRNDWDRSSASLSDPRLVVSPLNSRSRLRALIQGARRTLDLYAEEIADGSMESLLIHKERAGVRVRVLLASSFSSGAVASLRRGGVSVETPRHPYIHAKVVIADGRRAFVGSENMSVTSLDRNRELGILLTGSAVAQLRSVFASDWAAGG
jgi:cardiolipin synthase